MKLKKGQDLIISKAIPDDAKEIIDYLNIIGGESDNLLFGANEFTLTLEEEKKFIMDVSNSTKACMLIGRINGQIAAIVSLSGYARERIAHRGEIAVSVRKAYWNLGVGTAMMKELIIFAKEIAHMEVLSLEVKSDNRNAIQLYEKMGFRKIGAYEKFFKINGKYYDSDLMNLYL